MPRQPRNPRRPFAPLNLIGTDLSDTLRGNADDNTYLGGGGDDLLLGSGGNDTVIGGSGLDTLSYLNQSGPITLKRDGTILKADGSIDTRPDFSIETVIGARGQQNTLDASGGFIDPSVLAALNGAPLIDIDLSKERLTINGLPGIGSGSLTVNEFTHVIGTEIADNLTGNNGANDLNGSAGNDRLTGLGGADRLTGGSGADIFQFSPGDYTMRRFDTINDLEIGTDRIMAWESMGDEVTQLANTTSLRREDMSSLLSSITFNANTAVTFNMDERTFLAMNDATAGFQGNSDTMIEITGYSGNPADLSIG